MINNLVPLLSYENIYLIANWGVLPFWLLLIIMPNHSVNTWNIKGGDEYQEHLSGYKRDFFLEKGWDAITISENNKAGYSDQLYNQMLYVKELE